MFEKLKKNEFQILALQHAEAILKHDMAAKRSQNWRKCYWKWKSQPTNLFGVEVAKGS